MASNHLCCAVKSTRIYQVSSCRLLSSGPSSSLLCDDSIITPAVKAHRWRMRVEYGRYAREGGSCAPCHWEHGRQACRASRVWGLARGAAVVSRARRRRRSAGLRWWSGAARGGWCPPPRPGWLAGPPHTAGAAGPDSAATQKTQHLNLP